MPASRIAPPAPWLAACGAVICLAAPLASARRAEAADGVAVTGRDEARILPPRGARITGYANAGYWLVRRGAEIRVEVDASPLGSAAPFEPPRRWGRDSLARLARAQTAGAVTRYEAAARILGWVSRHIEYRLDRSARQDAAAVLERRDAYCTGVARLTVALLEAAGIEAREVAGYVVDDGSPSRIHGYHRWLEIHYPDLGWVMSDPLNSHHYVPATYVRLASTEIETAHGLEGLLLERRDGIDAVDVYRGVAAGVTVRRNTPRQLAAALRVTVEGGDSKAEALLLGASTVYLHRLTDGSATFVGLEPGRYQLELRMAGRDPVRHDMDLADRRFAGIRLRLGAPLPIDRSTPALPGSVKR